MKGFSLKHLNYVIKKFIVLSVGLPLIIGNVGAVDIVKESIALGGEQQLRELAEKSYHLWNKIHENLEGSSIDSNLSPNTKLERIKFLYKQFISLTDDEINNFKLTYHKKIDEINNEEALLVVLAECQTYFQNFLGISYDTESNPILSFSVLYSESVEDNKTISDDYVEGKLKEFSLKSCPFSLKEYSAEDIAKGSNAFNSFKTILLCAENPEKLEILKNNTKLLVDKFCNQLSNDVQNVKNGSPNLASGTLDESYLVFTSFSCYLGSEFFKTFEDVLAPKKDLTLNECLCDVKESCKSKIMSIDTFSIESKKYICDKIDNIKLNNSLAKDNYNLIKFNIEAFQLGENFIESLINLRNERRNYFQALSVDSKKQTTHLKNIILNDDFARIMPPASALSSDSISAYFICDDGPEYMLGTSKVVIPLIQYLRYKDTADYLSKKSDFNEEEILRILLQFVMAHELGHAIDIGIILKDEDELFKFGGLGGYEIEQKEEGYVFNQSETTYLTEIKNRLGEYAKSKINKTLSDNNEIFADYWAFEMLHDIAVKKRYSKDQIASMLKLIPYELTHDIYAVAAHKYKWDESDNHPPINIRMNGVVGNFDWFYDLGLDIKKDDFVYVNPEYRVRM